MLKFGTLVSFCVILCRWLFAFEYPQHVAVFLWFPPGGDFKTGLSSLPAPGCPQPRITFAPHRFNEHGRFDGGFLGGKEACHVFIPEETIINPGAFLFFLPFWPLLTEVLSSSPIFSLAQWTPGISPSFSLASLSSSNTDCLSSSSGPGCHATLRYLLQIKNFPTTTIHLFSDSMGQCVLRIMIS